MICPRVMVAMRASSSSGRRLLEQLRRQDLLGELGVLLEDLRGGRELGQRDEAVDLLGGGVGETAEVVGRCS